MGGWYPAVTEWSLGAGCVREVAIELPVAGDLPLRGSTQRLVRALLSPCGGPRDLSPIDAEVEALLAGSGVLLATGRLPERVPARVPAYLLLLIAALGVLALEPLARWRLAR